jgi:hypothetical protein
MRWATASQFRCAELPLRWFTQMETLITALQSPAENFICTYELAEKLSIDEDTRDRFEREIKIFLEAAIGSILPQLRSGSPFPLLRSRSEMHQLVLLGQ